MQRYTPEIDRFEDDYPHSNVLFNFYTQMPGVCRKTIAAWAMYIHDIDQSQGMLLVTLGFRQYTTEYTVANFWRPIRHRIIFASALEVMTLSGADNGYTWWHLVGQTKGILDDI